MATWSVICLKTWFSGKQIGPLHDPRDLIRGLRSTWESRSPQSDDVEGHVGYGRRWPLPSPQWSKSQTLNGRNPLPNKTPPPVLDCVRESGLPNSGTLLGRHVIVTFFGALFRHWGKGVVCFIWSKKIWPQGMYIICEGYFIWGGCFVWEGSQYWL